MRQATVEDAAEFGQDLAEEDVEEIHAAFGLGPVEGLERFHAMSGESMVVVREDGKVVCWFGATPIDGVPAANAWLLCGPDVKSSPVAFSRLVRRHLSDLSTRYGALVVFADERNADHARWLERIGFRAMRAHLGYGHEGRTFVEYGGVF